MTDDPGRPGVAIDDRQDLPVDMEALSDVARGALEAEGQVQVELAVSLVTEEEMAGLHQRYLGEPGPTDVLSFPQEDRAEDGRRRLLGDVVVCPAVARRQSADLSAELRLLVVHGILHLLGYDHEEIGERNEMWRRQEVYSGVGLPDEGPS
jgi:probable rRNA maturation factor